jgi:hypothetical protein
LFAVPNLISETPAPAADDPTPGTVQNPAPSATTDPEKSPVEEVASTSTPTTGSSTEHESAQPDSVTPDETAVTTPGTVAESSAGFAAWQKLSNELKQDPSVVLYLSFQNERAETEDDTTVSNEAEFGSSVGISLQPKKKTNWVEGRWPHKNAFYFDGGEDGQLLRVNEVDSQAFNLPESLSVMVWFKVDAFTSRSQTLISKGPVGFRLARYGESSGLAFAINHWRESGTKVSNSNVAPMAEADARKYFVDDGQWHLVTCVVHAREDETIVALYLDGQLQRQVLSESRMIPNAAPVMIGANSFFLTDKERKQPNGATTVDRARQFMGAIDEVAIFSRVLTPEEIVHIYQVGTTE